MCMEELLYNLQTCSGCSCGVACGSRLAWCALGGLMIDAFVDLITEELCFFFFSDLRVVDLRCKWRYLARQVNWLL